MVSFLTSFLSAGKPGAIGKPALLNPFCNERNTRSIPGKPGADFTGKSAQQLLVPPIIHRRRKHSGQRKPIITGYI